MTDPTVGALPSYAWQPPDRAFMAHLQDDSRYAALPAPSNPQVLRFQRVDGSHGHAQLLGHHPGGAVLGYDLDDLDPLDKKPSGICGGGIYRHPLEEGRRLFVKYDEATKPDGTPLKAAPITTGARTSHSEVGTSVLANLIGVRAVPQHYVTRGGILVGTASDEVGGTPMDSTAMKAMFPRPDHPAAWAMTDPTLGAVSGYARPRPQMLDAIAQLGGVDKTNLARSWGGHLALSAITQDHDRHGGNYLLQPSGDMVGLDFSRGFAPFVKLPDGILDSGFAHRAGARYKAGRAWTKPLRTHRLPSYYDEMGTFVVAHGLSPAGHAIRQGFVDAMDQFASLDHGDLKRAYGGEPHFWDGQRLEHSQELADKLVRRLS